MVWEGLKGGQADPIVYPPTKPPKVYGNKSHSKGRSKRSGLLTHHINGSGRWCYSMSSQDLAIEGDTLLTIHLSHRANARVKFTVTTSGYSASPRPISFRRWPTVSFPEALVRGTAWSEAQTLQVQIRLDHTDAKQPVQPVDTILTEAVRAKVMEVHTSRMPRRHQANGTSCHTNPWTSYADYLPAVHLVSEYSRLTLRVQ